MRDRIPINKSLCPYNFEIELTNALYIIGVNYNITGDFFTISLSTAEGEILSRGDKLIYGMTLWENIYDNRTFPCLTIKPVDAGLNEQEVTWDNFGNTVFLEIFNSKDDIDE